MNGACNFTMEPAAIRFEPATMLEPSHTFRRVLNRKNEELLVIFSNADLDHTSTVDKAEPTSIYTFTCT